jgi:hypothetical protein
MLKRLIAILLISSPLMAQQISPNQIRPGLNGQVLTTAGGTAGWAAVPSITGTVGVNTPIAVSGSGTLASPYIFSCPTCDTGSGTNVGINGGAAFGTMNLNGTTPAAAANSINVTWQSSGNNASAQITGDGNATHFLNGQGTFTAAGGSAAFSAITSGTNTTAAMVVGSGASLAPTGTGTIQATNVSGTVSAGTNITITGSGTTGKSLLNRHYKYYGDGGAWNQRHCFRRLLDSRHGCGIGDSDHRRNRLHPERRSYRRHRICPERHRVSLYLGLPDCQQR